MPKFALVSDLHDDFYEREESILPLLKEIGPETKLLIAGDTTNSWAKTNAFVNELDNHRKAESLFVLGNHEYYDGKNRILSAEQDFTLTNVEGALVASATMWTTFSNMDPLLSTLGVSEMNDRHVICGYRPAAIATICKRSVEFIFDSKPDVVVTHHAPSYACLSKRYRNDLALAGCYAEELGSYIADSNIKVWCFGHTHARATYIIGNTKLYTNARGYYATSYAPFMFEL